MLGTLTELGLFFKYSPKRSKLLKSVIMEENERRDCDRKINTTKIKVFCETRWVEWYIVLEEVKLLYDPILKTLEKITTEKGWDHKTIDRAHGLLRNITDSAFIYFRIYQTSQHNVTRYIYGCDCCLQAH